MFNLRDFVMSTLDMMRQFYPAFQVQQYALSYFAKGWIGEADLETVQGWFEPGAAGEEEE